MLVALLAASPAALVPAGPKAAQYWARQRARANRTRDSSTPHRHAAIGTLVKRARPSNHVRFLFVAGVEGSGHHAWGELFRVCEHAPKASLTCVFPQAMIQLLWDGADAYEGNTTGLFNTMDGARHRMLQGHIVQAFKRKLRQARRPSLYILNCAEHVAVGVGEMSFPSFRGKHTSIQLPDMVLLASLAEQAGADLRILLLTRSTTSVLRSVLLRGFDGQNMRLQSTMQTSGAMAMNAQLAALDARFVACVDHQALLNGTVGDRVGAFIHHALVGSASELWQRMLGTTRAAILARPSTRHASTWGAGVSDVDWRDAEARLEPAMQLIQQHCPVSAPRNSARRLIPRRERTGEAQPRADAPVTTATLGVPVPSGLVTTSLPDFMTTACSTPANPRGYLLYLGFKRQFNNQLRVLLENILLAHQLGRTLVLTGFRDVIQLLGGTSNGEDYYIARVTGNTRLIPVASVFQGLPHQATTFGTIDLDNFLRTCPPGGRSSWRADVFAWKQPWDPNHTDYIHGWQVVAPTVPGDSIAQQVKFPTWRLSEFPWNVDKVLGAVPELATLSLHNVSINLRMRASMRAPQRAVDGGFDLRAAMPSAKEVPLLVTDDAYYLTHAMGYSEAWESVLTKAYSELRWAPAIEDLAVWGMKEIMSRGEPYVAVHWRRGFLGSAAAAKLGVGVELANSMKGGVHMIASMIQRMVQARNDWGQQDESEHHLKHVRSEGGLAGAQWTSGKLKRDRPWARRIRRVLVASNSFREEDRRALLGLLGAEWEVLNFPLHVNRTTDAATGRRLLEANLLSRTEMLMCTCAARFTGSGSSTWSRTVSFMRTGGYYQGKQAGCHALAGRAGNEHYRSFAREE